MFVLIDTIVFLRLTFEPEAIPRLIQRSIDSAASRYLSVVSVWEIAVKASIGKLKLPQPVREYVRTRIQRMQLIPLDITLEHGAAVETLPWHHRDPFDRLLIAQAICEDLTLLTTDRVFARYRISMLPKIVGLFRFFSFSR